MLMIRRRSGESLFVGETIEVRVLEIAGGRVKLGISAPPDVLVLRRELKETEDFNREAAKPIRVHRITRLSEMLSEPEPRVSHRVIGNGAENLAPPL